MLARRALGVLFAIASLAGVDSDTAPQLIYGTYLGGRDKECSSAIAVDDSGRATIVGRTPSPDFPVTPGAFSTTTRVNNDDWTGFVSRLNEHGDRLLYSSFIGGNFRSSANAVATDSTGRAFVAGSTCSSILPTTPSAILRKAPGSNKTDACDGYVAWLSPDGSHLEYSTYLGGSGEDAATALSLSHDGKAIYVVGYTSSADFPIAGTAVQTKLQGASNGFFVAIDIPSGQLLYSTYLGGASADRVNAIAVAPDETVYVAGTTTSSAWPGVQLVPFGNLGRSDGFIVRIDPRAKRRPFGIRFGGSGDEILTSIAVDSRADIYAVGSTDSQMFPVKGRYSRQVGSAFVLKFDGPRFSSGQAKILWSRRLGGHDEDELLSVSAGLPGSIFVSGRSGSKDFPTTPGAVYRSLAVENDSVLIRLRASDGGIRYSTFVGGTRQPNAAWYNDEATGVFANRSGDVFVTGCTLDDRLPVTADAFQTRPKGNSEPFVLRLKFAP